MQLALVVFENQLPLSGWNFPRPDHLEKELPALFIPSLFVNNNSKWNHRPLLFMGWTLLSLVSDQGHRSESVLVHVIDRAMPHLLVASFKENGSHQSRGQPSSIL
eukprot:GHVT01020697.1.p1 GENE.GHVT01020697.1~~GHVT01020697.1.p1  ORF type:complete len:105 (-),score=4.87 GHVT01020697.1:341-655(-)